MSKLRQLPISGDWVQPSDITGVNANGPFHDERVSVTVVFKGGTMNEFVVPGGIEEARKVRDEIAGWAMKIKITIPEILI